MTVRMTVQQNKTQCEGKREKAKSKQGWRKWRKKDKYDELETKSGT